MVQYRAQNRGTNPVSSTEPKTTHSNTLPSFLCCCFSVSCHQNLYLGCVIWTCAVREMLQLLARVPCKGKVRSEVDSEGRNNRNNEQWQGRRSSSSTDLWCERLCSLFKTARSTSSNNSHYISMYRWRTECFIAVSFHLWTESGQILLPSVWDYNLVHQMDFLCPLDLSHASTL